MNTTEPDEPDIVTEEETVPAPEELNQTHPLEGWEWDENDFFPMLGKRGTLPGHTIITLDEQFLTISAHECTQGNDRRLPPEAAVAYGCAVLGLPLPVGFAEAAAKIAAKRDDYCEHDHCWGRPVMRAGPILDVFSGGLCSGEVGVEDEVKERYHLCDMHFAPFVAQAAKCLAEEAEKLAKPKSRSAADDTEES